MQIDRLAFQILKARFAAIGHTPSHAQLEALYDILHTLTLMLNGQLDMKFYLSSLHPGIGKSTAIISWVQAYQQCHKEYGDQGVIMCFDRHEEIVRMVRDLNLPPDSFAVKVANHASNSDLNGMGLGSHRIDEALILLTTKPQITILGQLGRKFGDMSGLFYHGRPRTTRIVDESMAQGVGRKLVIRKLAKLPDELSDSHPALAHEIEGIADELRTYGNGDTHFIQNLSKGARSSLLSFKWKSGESREVAHELLQLCGREVTVRSSDRGHVAIDCDDTWPVDLVVYRIVCKS